MYIGQNLRRERDAKGWSQEALGLAAGGISQGTVSLIESDKQEACYEQIMAFSKALDVTPDRLIFPQAGSVLHIETQNGHQLNNGTNYISHSEGEVSALRDRIKAQEEEIIFLRQQLRATLETKGTLME